jgi:hypothetical protein
MEMGLTRRHNAAKKKTVVVVSDLCGSVALCENLLLSSAGFLKKTANKALKTACSHFSPWANGMMDECLRCQ